MGLFTIDDEILPFNHWKCIVCVGSCKNKEGIISCFKQNQKRTNCPINCQMMMDLQTHSQEEEEA